MIGALRVKYRDQCMRIRYLSHLLAEKAQARLRICAVSLEPLLPHINSMGVDEGSDQNLCLDFCWIRQN